ncbi:thioesterase II family protein [Actinomadura gamaensis]|uniref:Thioesterase II family protein n=1 Tax=Actinomadura gamaensis TaxID=1763541 RepID=A0ABV9TXK9_9ACTN
MTRPKLVSPWFWIPHPRPDAELRLFCFPHAGGDASSFTGLSVALPPSVEVWALRLPGRGGRLAERLPRDLDALVRQLVAVLRPELTRPYALLGQSLGAMTAYQVARELAGWRPPVGCVLAALLPPHLWTGPPGPDDPAELAEFLHRVDPATTEILAHPGLREIALSAVTADLALCHGYRYRPAPPLDRPIHALVGDADPTVTPAQMREWARYTTAPFTLSAARAGHLVVQAAPAAAAGAVGRLLPSSTQRP